MVKEIGMRVGGPSESQVRGMRSEREIRKRGSRKRQHTYPARRRKKKDKEQNKNK